MRWLPRFLRSRHTADGTAPVQDHHHVDPARISLVCNNGALGTELHQEILSALPTSIERSGDWDQPLHVTFEELDVYKAFHDHFIGGKPWEGTAFYTRVMKKIDGGHKRWGCSTEEAFRERLNNDVDRLFETIRAEGYRTQKELNSSKPHDEIRVAVDRHGRLLFVDGRHRLCIAKLLNIDEVPVRVVLRHPGSQAYRTAT